VIKNSRVLALIGVLSLCVSVGVLAQERARPVRKPGISGLMAHKGGLIRAPVTGPVILVLNAQQRVADAEVVAVAARIEQSMKLAVQCQSGKAVDPMAEAVRRVAEPKVAAVLLVCDKPGLPMLLVAPEARWAIVNVAALAADKPEGTRLSERLEKELWRGFGYLMGAAHSGFERCVMKSVCQPSDLDQLAGRCVSPEPYIKIQQHALKIGASPYAFTSYRQACEQGWAPAPTNALQRAVWDDVKAEKK